jgi:hypothetical protein
VLFYDVWFIFGLGLIFCRVTKNAVVFRYIFELFFF